MMPRDDKLLALIGQLYDVVLAPQRWPPLLEVISDLFGGAPVLFGQRNLKTGEPGRAFTARTHSEAFDIYMQDYRDPKVNPLALPLQALATGCMLRRQEVIDDHAFQGTAVYNELFRPYREIPLVTISLSGDPDVKANLSLRTNELGRFLRPDDIQILRQLIPHLQRVLQLEQRLAQSHNLHAASEEALDRLQIGVLVVDAKGKIQLVNQRAAAIIDLADGLRIVQRQLHTARSDDTKVLHQLIHQAIQTTTAQGTGSGGFLHVLRPSGLRPFQLLTTPMTRQALWENSPSPAALVFVTDPEREDDVPAQILQRLYGLTHAESEMAILMSQGHGLAYAADHLQVTLNTAKSHQRQIFAKTGVHRQAELVRLLLTSLARIARPAP